MSEHLAAHRLVGGTVVGAGGAADAAQGVSEVGVVTHGPAAIVQQNDVYLLRAVDAHGHRKLNVPGAAGAGDEAGVGG